MGSSVTKEGVNFAIYAKYATYVSLILFEKGVDASITSFVLCDKINKTGDIWHILIKGIDPQLIRYGYSMDMQPNPNPTLFCFDPEVLLIDPYAKAISGASRWGEMSHRVGEKLPKTLGVRKRRSIIEHSCFDWGNDTPPNTPMSQTIIYELHLRGFTADTSSGVTHKGSYLGLCEKIPYLQELGITAVELLPIFEFEESGLGRTDPTTNKPLLNFWGYDPITFFAPKASYASDTQENIGTELKKMVKSLHQAGIEVILDVVFNHTAEGEVGHHTFNYRGIENPTYYLIDKQKEAYENYSGCGNTLNCNHPVVSQMIIDALHHWVSEYHIDGFRFDLASILTRGEDGVILSNPPILERISNDPILANTKLIAEAWDASGLYQLGSFPVSTRWAEWNGKFRDDIRTYIKADNSTVPALAARMMGSPDIYQESGRSSFCSINFVTCHDGFTLRDLVSYNQKHNIRNGEQNRDGSNDNDAWNCGIEGECEDDTINTLRLRQQKNIALLLFLADGTPMMMAGDEFGRTQKGTNNAYCQDNEISWIDWSLLKKHQGLFRFFKLLIAHKKHYRIHKKESYLKVGSEIYFHGVEADQPDWNSHSHTLGIQLQCIKKKEEEEMLVERYLFSNAHWQSHTLILPILEDKQWYLIVDTSLSSPKDFNEEPLLLENQRTYRVIERSTIVLEGR